MPLRTLSLRIAVPAGFFALISVALLSLLLIRSQREQILAEAIHGSESIAETIRLSVDHAMRSNRREGIREIIESVGRHAGIDGVRLFNKEGRISYSSREDEVGHVVDKRAEACLNCHHSASPDLDLDPEDRSRLYTDPQGRRILSTIRVIRNEEGCEGSGCHQSPDVQSVLGVLDVAISLEPAQARLRAATGSAILVALVAVVVTTGVLFLLIWQSVRRPVNRLIAATRSVAAGDLDQHLAPGATGEIGFLAHAFNEMVESLNSSKQHLDEWTNTLEENVTRKAEELRAARFQIVQAEKLSSVGLVAAGIAHELNSPLMAIITFTHLVRGHVPSDSQAHEDLRTIEREANRCAAIIRQLLDFSREQVEDPGAEPCRLEEAVHDALALLKIELQNHHVEWDASLPRDLPFVDANGVQLVQVFVNLILNALQAMPEGGRITITADVVARSDCGQVGLPPHPSEQLVRASVRDTGSGIPPEDLSKVFDPFFTTKPVGQGSGLGLSVSLGLVRGYRGTIQAHSDGETGSEFIVLLPVSAGTRGLDDQ